MSDSFATPLLIIVVICNLAFCSMPTYVDTADIKEAEAQCSSHNGLQHLTQWAKSTGNIDVTCNDNAVISFTHGTYRGAANH